MRYQRIVRSLLALFFGVGLAVAVLHAQAPAAPQAAPPGQSLEHPQGTNAGIFAFTGRCAACHDNGTGGAPDRYTLNRLWLFDGQRPGDLVIRDRPDV